MTPPLDAYCLEPAPLTDSERVIVEDLRLMMARLRREGRPDEQVVLAMLQEAERRIRLS